MKLRKAPDFMKDATNVYRTKDFICLLQGRNESVLGVDIFSTVYLGVPFMIVLIFTLSNEMIERELPFAITSLTVFGAIFVLGLSILILQIRNRSVKKRKKEV